ncbi:hypothetical protein D9611_011343 [Ephemerocybe angulata]|uniref:Uncharacterized protein n=1 Tax=Ephemerocybe angulata TaxID=980116 RepID=A0A8H5BDU0_9AGAR|nr:hypothetical protein D9611_011343 [Tulosesus angulatus]
MLKELYDESYPRFLLFGKGKQPLPEGIIPPSTRTPRYLLGWMIRVPEIRTLAANYLSFRFDVTWPIWKAKNFKLATQSEMNRVGLQVPQLWKVGENYVIISIAQNHLVMMAALKSERNRRVLLKQALGALDLAPGCFEPLTIENLIWLRWEKGAQFSDADYPCVGEHLWSDDSESVGSGELSTLPPLPKEMVAIIETRYRYDGSATTKAVPSSEVTPEEAK